jgi:hypothetical protein
MTTVTLNESNPVTTGSMQPQPVNPGTGPANTNNAYQVITLAMRNAGYLDKLQDPSSDDLAEYMPRLNSLVNFEITQGLKLWLEQDVSFTAIQGYNNYQFGSNCTNTVAGTYFNVPRPLSVKEAYWQDAWGNRRPLISMSRNDWDTLGTVITQGPVNSYYSDRQQNFLNLWIWLSADYWTANYGQVHAILRVQANQVISITDAMNFPVEWFQFLQWALAAEIDTGQPKEITDTCDKMTAFYRNALEGWDTEDANTVFQPDSRTQYVLNRFV